MSGVALAAKIYASKTRQGFRLNPSEMRQAIPYSVQNSSLLLGVRRQRALVQAS